MSKSYKPRSGTLLNEVAANVYRQGLQDHRKEKRLVNVLRSKNIEELIVLDDELDK